MREIEAKEALEWLNSGLMDVIDVREPAEFAAEHVAGARSIPLGQLGTTTLLPAPGRKLLFVCASGRRSALACERLATAGGEVFSLAGGIGAWRAAGGSIVKGQRKVIPLERQVLAIAGFLVLTGVILSYLVHPWFLGLTAFVGAGLMVAGLTGFCGMALLLARAPWNQRGDAVKPFGS
jgi:rhodanese-related sulfurtransferase